MHVAWDDICISFEYFVNQNEMEKAQEALNILIFL
jgi:hypothetical protein